VKQSGVSIVKGIVKEVQQEKIILKDGTEIPYGLLVWSTGVGPSEFVNNLTLPKSRGRFVEQHENIAESLISIT
jgi:NADH:ubiquinone reductase (non-electrogenic)